MAHWQFRPLNPNETSGASTVDDNFADEERTSVEILVRETLQNPLDARSGPDVVRVRYSLVSLAAKGSSFVSSIFTDDWGKHFSAGKLIEDSGTPDRIPFLVVEDFGTTGLEGCYTDSSVDGRSENWNAFWFREGEGAKPTKSNGGAGQGKITLFLASKMRSVFALTRRKSDGQELLFGCCRFKRNYKLPGDDRRWAKEARWGASRNPDDLATPILDARLISAAKEELGLHRQALAGTTFIVPMPTDVTRDSLREAVINEFFFAIRRGRLEVEIDGELLAAGSIEDAANSLGAKCRLPKGYREFLSLAATRLADKSTASARIDWNRTAKISDSSFTKEGLEALKVDFERAALVTVDFPISVKSKSSGQSSLSTFRVVLQLDQEGEQSQELFVRQDLGIDGEKRLRSARAIHPVMALTFIDDLALSDLLVAAEEPTHRNWNGKRPKVVAMYASPDKALNAVRNAALRLVQLISPQGSRDESALAVFFSDPDAPPNTIKGGPGIVPESKNAGKTIPPEIPPPQTKPVSVTPATTGFKVKGVAGHSTGEKFPLRCEIELAYATTSGDSYKLWDAADFWLPNEKLFPVLVNGISHLKMEGNALSFTMIGPEAEFSISGFDPNRRLDVRVRYQEVADEADIAHH